MTQAERLRREAKASAIEDAEGDLRAEKRLEKELFNRASWWNGRTRGDHPKTLAAEKLAKSAEHAMLEAKNRLVTLKRAM